MSTHQNNKRNRIKVIIIAGFILAIVALIVIFGGFLKKDNSSNQSSNTDNSSSVIGNETNTNNNSLVTYDDTDDVIVPDEDEESDGDFFSQKDIIDNNIKYRTYCNGRFGFCVDYPADFTVQQAPQNGDGRVFKSKNAELIASASWAFLLGEDIKEAFENSKEWKHSITYEKQKDNWFILSGYNENGKIYYTKTVFVKKKDPAVDNGEEDDVEINVTLEYNPSEKSFYEKMIPHIFNSIK